MFVCFVQLVFTCAPVSSVQAETRYHLDMPFSIDHVHVWALDIESLSPKNVFGTRPPHSCREKAAVPYCLMSRMHSESPTPRNVLQQFDGTKNISGSLIMSSWAETPLKGGVVINASSTLAVPAVSFSRSGLQLARSSCSSWCTSLPTEAQNDSRCNLTLPRFPTPPPWLP